MAQDTDYKLMFMRVPLAEYASIFGKDGEFVSELKEKNGNIQLRQMHMMGPDAEGMQNCFLSGSWNGLLGSIKHFQSRFPSFLSYVDSSRFFAPVPSQPNQPPDVRTLVLAHVPKEIVGAFIRYDVNLLKSAFSIQWQQGSEKIHTRWPIDRFNTISITGTPQNILACLLKMNEQCPDTFSFVPDIVVSVTVFFSNFERKANMTLPITLNDLSHSFPPQIVCPKGVKVPHNSTLLFSVQLESDDNAAPPVFSEIITDSTALALLVPTRGALHVRAKFPIACKSQAACSHGYKCYYMHDPAAAMSLPTGTIDPTAALRGPPPGPGFPASHAGMRAPGRGNSGHRGPPPFAGGQAGFAGGPRPRGSRPFQAQQQYAPVEHMQSAQQQAYPPLRPPQPTGQPAPQTHPEGGLPNLQGLHLQPQPQVQPQVQPQGQPQVQPQVQAPPPPHMLQQQQYAQQPGPGPQQQYQQQQYQQQHYAPQFPRQGPPGAPQVQMQPVPVHFQQQQPMHAFMPQQYYAQPQYQQYAAQPNAPVPQPMGYPQQQQPVYHQYMVHPSQGQPQQAYPPQYNPQQNPGQPHQYQPMQQPPSYAQHQWVAQPAWQGQQHPGSHLPQHQQQHEQQPQPPQIASVVISPAVPQPVLPVQSPTSQSFSKLTSAGSSASLEVQSPRLQSSPSPSPVPPLPGLVDKFFHAFLTHDWAPDQYERDNHATVARINAGLQQRGLVTWFDSERMQGSVKEQMAAGIEKSVVVVCFITQRYLDKVTGSNAGDNCKLEFGYAANVQTPEFMLAVPMEERCKKAHGWPGIVGLTLGTRLYRAHFEETLVSDAKAFEEQMDILATSIRELCIVKGTGF